MKNPLLKKATNPDAEWWDSKLRNSMSKVYLDKYCRGGIVDNDRGFPAKMRDYAQKAVFGSVKIGQRRSKLATGEMSRSEVTREAYPIQFAIADAVGGTVEPFDVYQGPYVKTDQGNLFVTVEEGGMATVWNEDTTNESNAFFYDDENGAVEAALSVLPGKPKSVKPKPVEKEKKIRKTPQFSDEDKIYLHGLGVQGSKLASLEAAMDGGELTIDRTRNRFRLANAFNRELISIVAEVNDQLRRRHIPEDPKAHEAAIRRIARTMKVGEDTLPPKPSLKSDFPAPVNARVAEDTLTRFAKQAARATHVIYDAGPTSYKVLVMRGDNVIDEYEAGNSHYDSTVETGRTDKGAIEYERLLEMAEQTAKETARDWGVSEDAVEHDDDILSEEREVAGMDFTSDDRDVLKGMGIKGSKAASRYFPHDPTIPFSDDAKAPKGVKLDPNTLPPPDPEAKARVEEKHEKFKSKMLQSARRRDPVQRNKYSEADLNYLFDWFGNVFGDLKPDIRKRLMRVVNNPTEKNWDNAYSIILNTTGKMTTLWKAVIAVDPWFPKTGPSEDFDGNRLRSWEQVPDQELLVKALLNVAGLNSMPKKPTVDEPFTDEDKDIMRGMGITGAKKPKCPHCGSGHYSLMPTDFETAKCSDCGKNWDHGIVPGINDPSDKTAGKQTHWWPYGRHKFEPQEGIASCKACDYPADHSLHTTPPPSTPEEAFEQTRNKNAFFSPEDAAKFRAENGGSNVLLPDAEEEEEDDYQRWEPVFEEGLPVARVACLPCEYCPDCHKDAERCKCPDKQKKLDGKTVGDHMKEATTKGCDYCDGPDAAGTYPIGEYWACKKCWEKEKGKKAADDDSGNWYVRVKEGEFWIVLKDERNRAIPFSKADASKKALEVMGKKGKDGVSVSRSWMDKTPVEWVEKYKKVCPDCDLPKDSCECPPKTASVKTAAVYKVEQQSSNNWIVVGLPSLGWDNEGVDKQYPNTTIVPGMNHSLRTPEGLTQGIYEQLYDEFQTNDNLKEGDIFDTPVGQFICEGFHVLPHDEKAKAALQAVDNMYKCGNCGCDQGDHRREYDPDGSLYFECMNHPDTCKEFTKRKSAAMMDMPPAIVREASASEVRPAMSFPVQVHASVSTKKAVKPAFEPQPLEKLPLSGTVRPALEERLPEGKTHVYVDMRNGYREI